MKTLKSIPLALAALTLSSAAFAHGWDRGYRDHGRGHGREERREARYEQRYEPRCESARRVEYIPARVIVAQPRYAIQPGVQLRITIGL